MTTYPHKIIDVGNDDHRPGQVKLSIGHATSAMVTSMTPDEALEIASKLIAHVEATREVWPEGRTGDGDYDYESACELCGLWFDNDELDYRELSMHRDEVRLGDGTIDDVFLFCGPCFDEARDRARRP